MSKQLETYFTLKRLSKSGLSTAADRPYDYYLNYLDPNREPLDTKALRFGSLAHAMLFEPQEVYNRYLIADEEAELAAIGGAKPRATTAYKEWISLVNDSADKDNKTLVFQSHYDQIKAMIQMLEKSPIATALVSNGKPEHTVLWECEFTGLEMKAKLDMLHLEFDSLDIPELEHLHGKTVIVDYKTSKSIRPKDIRKDFYGYRYDWQHAVYIDGVSKSMGIDRNDIHFIFITQEKDAPYLFDFIELSYEQYWTAQGEYVRTAQELAPMIKSYTKHGVDPMIAFKAIPNSLTSNVDLPTWNR